MDKKKISQLIEYLIVATILIATSFTPYKLAGMLIAIAYTVLEGILRRQGKKEKGGLIKGLPGAIKESWLYILLVVFVTPSITLLIGKLFLPDYFAHVLERVAPYVKMDSLDTLFGQLFILAFGEEIVFRAFLQGKLSQFIKPWLAILLSSIVFVALHFTPGVLIIVVMDLLSVFIDSLLFGIIYERSKNVLASTVAHFLGNSFAMVLLLIISKGIV